MFSHGSNHSGGVAVCLNRCPGKVVASKADETGHWLAAVLNAEGTFVILMNVYGFNNGNQNKLLLSELTDVISEYKGIYHTDFIVIGGDLNLMPDEWQDRCPSRYDTKQWNTILFDFTNSSNLIDVWRDRNPDISPFSWIKPNGSCKSRIDLWLATPEIVKYVSNVSISSAPLTDHCVIQLILNPESRTKYKKDYWKLNADFLKDEEYIKTIRDLIKKIRMIRV